MPDKIKNIFQESELLDLCDQGFRSIAENKLDEALSHFEEVAAVVRNAKDHKLICLASAAQALAYQKQEHRRKALAINKEALTISITTLELLGLTKREVEVLFWITKDKSNAQIAKGLGCREGTVRKHLENLYKKLGVQTRTGAVMVALDKLGLLKGSFVARLS